MVSSQSIVIGWFEYAVAGALLLAATKMIVGRLRQPVDRVNFIAMSVIASAIVPLLLSFMSVPSYSLRLFSNNREQVASVQATSHSPIPRQMREVPVALIPRTEQPAQIAPLATDQNDALHQANAISTQADTASIAAFSPDLSASPATAPTGNQFSRWSIAAAMLLLIHGSAIAWFLFQWIIGAVRLRNISRRAMTPNQSLLDA